MFNGGQSEEDLIKQLIELLSGENAKEVEKLIIEITENIQVDGSKIDFDKEFSQNYDALLILAIEVVKLNYLDSFSKTRYKFTKRVNDVSRVNPQEEEIPRRVLNA